MARSYHVEIASFAADADNKWVDNLLSRFELHGVESARQGVARKISMSGIYHIAIVRRLVRDVGLPVEAAINLATRLLGSPNGRAALSPALDVQLDRPAFEQQIGDLVAEAVETTAPARRGRPPRRPALD